MNNILVVFRFLPFPRFPLPGDPTAYIVCVEDNPRYRNNLVPALQFLSWLSTVTQILFKN